MGQVMRFLGKWIVRVLAKPLFLYSLVLSRCPPFSIPHASNQEKKIRASRPRKPRSRESLKNNREGKFSTRSTNLAKTRQQSATVPCVSATVNSENEPLYDPLLLIKMNGVLKCPPSERRLVNSAMTWSYFSANQPEIFLLQAIRSI